MSKGLEIIKNRLISLVYDYQHFERDDVKAKLIKDDIKDLKTVEKELKGLEIIKTYFPNLLKNGANAFEVLDFKMHHKDEYDLLKEVLG